GVEMVSHAFEWPIMVARVTTVLLIVGVPVASLLAWYHGERAQHRVSGAELSMLTLLLIIAGSALWLVSRTSGEHPAAAAPASNPAARAPHPIALPSTAPPAIAPAASIAVVPFANLTGEPAKDYLSDGMAEELINALALVPGLKVPSRT